LSSRSVGLEYSQIGSRSSFVRSNAAGNGGAGSKRNSAAQLVEQRYGVFQVGGLEAFREPGIGFREHCASLVAPVGLR
jgi:hypothetical protein